MKDFTKIKLINSLIDVVDHFYEVKNSSDYEASTHLKGFCEGMAYTLMELDFLTKDEVDKIMNGYGKKLSLNVDNSKTDSKELEILDHKYLAAKKDDKDISNLKEVEIVDKNLHSSPIFTPRTELDNLDLPAYLRKKRNS